MRPTRPPVSTSRGNPGRPPVNPGLGSPGRGSPRRPTVGPGRGGGRLRTLLYRHRSLRWAAAVGASVAAFMALRAPAPSEPGEDCALVAAAQATGPADVLPASARGVPVPNDSSALAVGDVVDVHAVLGGAAIVRDAVITGHHDNEAVVAVPAERVGSVVDALAAGGVVLVLVPR